MNARARSAPFEKEREDSDETENANDQAGTRAAATHRPIRPGVSVVHFDAIRAAAFTGSEFVGGKKAGGEVSDANAGAGPDEQLSTDSYVGSVEFDFRARGSSAGEGAQVGDNVQIELATPDQGTANARPTAGQRSGAAESAGCVGNWSSARHVQSAGIAILKENHKHSIIDLAGNEVHLLHAV